MPPPGNKIAVLLRAAERSAETFAAEDADATGLRVGHQAAIGEHFVDVKAVAGHEKRAAVVAVHRDDVGLFVERRDAGEEENALQFAGGRSGELCEPCTPLQRLG